MEILRFRTFAGKNYMIMHGPLLAGDEGGGLKAECWVEYLSISPRQSSNTWPKPKSASVGNVPRSTCLPTPRFFFELVSIHAALFTFANCWPSVGSTCLLKERKKDQQSQYRFHETELTIVASPTWSQRSHKVLVEPHKNPGSYRRGFWPFPGNYATPPSKQ